MSTKIEWTEVTWNPVTGCTPVSPACEHCYARRMAKRLAGRGGYPAAPHEFDVTIHSKRLSEPLAWKTPRRVFVVSMGDLFHAHVPDEFIYKIFAIMALCPEHTFQILTKRPQRMAQIINGVFFSSQVDRIKTDLMSTIMSDQGRSVDAYIGEEGYFENGYLKNVWIGVTAENQEQADRRIPVLLQIPAAVRFVSVEPMLGRLDLTRWLTATTGQHWQEGHPESPYPERPGGYTEWWPCLNWVICGGETGPGARPMHPDWARSLRDQCAVAGVPFFFKKMGSAWSGETPPDLLVREYAAQEVADR